MTSIVGAEKPTIVTAGWATSLPPAFVRIGISRGAPRRHPAGYRMYRRLAPGRWFRSVGVEEYIRLYSSEILAKLDPSRVLADLRRIGGGLPVALLCFEAPGTSEWCHRSLAAHWLATELGIIVPEFGYEGRPTHQHPLLPASLRGDRPR